MSNFRYLVPDDTAMIGVCIFLFRDTIPGYYENMTLRECTRKMERTRMWMATAAVDWQDSAGNPGVALLALAFHKRERFGTSNQPPHYYLSVGISRPLLSDVASGARQIAQKIKDECDAFRANIMAGLNELYFAHHESLVLSPTRLGPIVAQADNNAWLEQASLVQPGIANNNTTIVWPRLTGARSSSSTATVRRSANMPMPDPTGDTGRDHGFFNERRLSALLVILVLALLGIVAWLVYTISSRKPQPDKAAVQAPIEAGGNAAVVRALL